MSGGIAIVALIACLLMMNTKDKKKFRKRLGGVNNFTFMYCPGSFALKPK